MNEKSEEKKTDRKLGDQWEDWDGDLTALEVEIPGPKSRFLLFAALFIVVFAGILGGLFYLIQPRLAQFGEIVPWIVGGAFALKILVLVKAWSWTTLVCLGWKWSLLARLGRRTISLYRSPTFALGRMLGISPDRMSASYINVNNALTEAISKKVNPERVLVLLPRCLSREKLKAARAICEEHGCKAHVVGGGTAARKLVVKHDPRAILALACERDLFSGIEFLKNRHNALALANRRPFGPCKDTEFDEDRFREMLEFFLEKK